MVAVSSTVSTSALAYSAWHMQDMLILGQRSSPDKNECRQLPVKHEADRAKFQAKPLKADISVEKALNAPSCEQPSEIIVPEPKSTDSLELPSNGTMEPPNIVVTPAETDEDTDASSDEQVHTLIKASESSGSTQSIPSLKLSCPDDKLAPATPQSTEPSNGADTPPKSASDSVEALIKASESSGSTQSIPSLKLSCPDDKLAPATPQSTEPSNGVDTPPKSASDSVNDYEGSPVMCVLTPRSLFESPRSPRGPLKAPARIRAVRARGYKAPEQAQVSAASP